MKKIIAMVIALCLMFASSLALATSEDFGPDNPFLPGVDYSEKYNDYGAVPAQLNFGTLKMSDLQKGSDASAKTVKTMSAAKMEEALINDELWFYAYAKYQTSKSVPDHTVDTMLVMQDPNGDYYTTYSSFSVQGIGSGYRYTGIGRFFDASMGLYRCFLYNKELPKGEYILTMYFNDQFFRSTSFVLK